MTLAEAKKTILSSHGKRIVQMSATAAVLDALDAGIDPILSRAADISCWRLELGIPGIFTVRLK